MSSIDEQGNFELNDQDKDYLQWLKKNKIKLSKCSIGYFTLGGRGAIATEDIKEGEVVISVPDDMVLLPDHLDCAMSSTLQDTPFGHRGRNNTLNETIGLVLALVGEYLQGKKSKWHGYIQSFIHSSPTFPGQWQDQSLFNQTPLSSMNLFGLPLCGWDSDDQTSHLSIFHKILPLLSPTSSTPSLSSLSSLPALSSLPYPPPSKKKISLSPKLLYQIFLYSIKHISAYSFELGDDHFQGLVPFFDMLNHISGHANVRLNHCEKKGLLQMIASRPIAKGTQLINTYGDVAPSQLLRCYGYCELPPSPAVSVCTAFLRIPPFICLVVEELAVWEREGRGEERGEREKEFYEEWRRDWESKVVGVAMNCYALKRFHLCPSSGWLRLAAMVPGALPDYFAEVLFVFFAVYCHVDFGLAQRFQLISSRKRAREEETRGEEKGGEERGGEERGEEERGGEERGREETGGEEGEKGKEEELFGLMSENFGDLKFSVEDYLNQALGEEGLESFTRCAKTVLVSCLKKKRGEREVRKEELEASLKQGEEGGEESNAEHVQSMIFILESEIIAMQRCIVSLESLTKEEAFNLLKIHISYCNQVYLIDKEDKEDDSDSESDEDQ